MATERNDRNWIRFDEALAYTGRSPATLRRAISAGKIGKRAVSVPGRRPEIHLSRADVDRFFASPVYTYSPAPVTQSERKREQVSSPDHMAALVPAPNGNLPGLLERIGEVLTTGGPLKLCWTLCWTLKDARTMTGLSLPALRELVEAHPDLAIRRGRRMWLKAGKLREVLG